jgi:hypothetical protein
MAIRLKIFLLLAAFAALGVLGTGATILCTDGVCGTAYKAGTTIDLTLKSGSSGTPLSCSASTPCS